MRDKYNFKKYLINLSPTTYERLGIISKLTVEPISAVIRRALEEYVQKFDRSMDK